MCVCVVRTLKVFNINIEPLNTIRYVAAYTSRRNLSSVYRVFRERVPPDYDINIYILYSINLFLFLPFIKCLCMFLIFFSVWLVKRSSSFVCVYV